MTSVITAMVVLASTSGLGVVAGANQTPSIESTAFVGDGVVGENDVTELWNDGSYRLNLTVGSSAGTYSVCAGETTSESRNCQTVTFENGTNDVSVGRFPWTANDTGRHNVTVSIKNTGTPEIYDSVEVAVKLLDPTGDLDNDGLSNRQEVEHGTNMTRVDTDGDGLHDGPEVNTYGTDPLSNDTDEDGLNDATEVNRDTDPTDADTDDDGLEDGPEVNVYGTNASKPDTDEDGLEDGPEVHQYGTDPDDSDSDDDGYDDGREVNVLGTNATNDNVPTETEANETMLPPSFDDPLFLVGFVAILGAGIAIGISVIRGRSLGDRLPGGDSASGEASVEADDESADEGTFGPAPPPSSMRGESESTGSRTAEDDSGPAPILTDEERVLDILGNHDGQVKQQRIVHETEWSKSKVSRLLSRMDDDGAVRKITLGRENVIRIPDTGEDESAETADDDRE